MKGKRPGNKARTQKQHIELMFTYKINECKKRGKKDKQHVNNCISWHPKSDDRRRDPRLYIYTVTEKCVDYHSERGKCPLGDRCSKYHHKFEALYHPRYYKTNKCRFFVTKGYCTHKNCAFIHPADEGEEPVDAKTREKAKEIIREYHKQIEERERRRDVTRSKVTHKNPWKKTQQPQPPIGTPPQTQLSPRALMGHNTTPISPRSTTQATAPIGTGRGVHSNQSPRTPTPQSPLSPLSPPSPLPQNYFVTSNSLYSPIQSPTSPRGGPVMQRASNLWTDHPPQPFPPMFSPTSPQLSDSNSYFSVPPVAASPPLGRTSSASPLTSPITSPQMSVGSLPFEAIFSRGASPASSPQQAVRVNSFEPFYYSSPSTSGEWSLPSVHDSGSLSPMANRFSAIFQPLERPRSTSSDNLGNGIWGQSNNNSYDNNINNNNSYHQTNCINNRNLSGESLNSNSPHIHSSSINICNDNNNEDNRYHNTHPNSFKNDNNYYNGFNNQQQRNNNSLIENGNLSSEFNFKLSI